MARIVYKSSNPRGITKDDFKLTEEKLKEILPMSMSKLVSNLQYTFGYSESKVEQILKVLNDIGKIIVGNPPEYIVEIKK